MIPTLKFGGAGVRLLKTPRFYILVAKLFPSSVLRLREKPDRHAQFTLLSRLPRTETPITAVID